jgi:hypothetical protein
MFAYFVPCALCLVHCVLCCVACSDVVGSKEWRACSAELGVAPDAPALRRDQFVAALDRLDCMYVHQPPAQSLCCAVLCCATPDRLCCVLRVVCCVQRAGGVPCAERFGGARRSVRVHSSAAHSVSAAGGGEREYPLRVSDSADSLMLTSGTH